MSGFFRIDSMFDDKYYSKSYHQALIMKKTLSIIAISIASQCAYAQTNSFPPTGNVGIGTSSPNAALHVENGTALVNKDVLGGLGGQISIGNGYGNQNGTVRLNLNNGGAVSWIKSVVTGANTNTGSAMVFGVPSNTADGIEMMRITENGYLGIGTSSPIAKLNVKDGDILVSTDKIADLGGQITISNGYGNQNGAVRLNLNNGGAVSWIKGLVTGANTNTGSAIVFGVPSNTTDGLEVMRITGNGYLGIGTASPDARLSVNGTIHSNEVKVDATQWPDYVFKPNYSLLPLPQVKIYIDKNLHLPDMPSEQEIAKDGLNLGEMNKLLTKKIEELTLYLIEQHKVNQTQQDQINKLTTQVTRLIKK